MQRLVGIRGIHLGSMLLCSVGLWTAKLTLFPQPHETWHPPKPDLQDTRPFQNTSNIFLDDIEQELNVLILQRPDDELKLAQDHTVLSDSSNDLARALSCQNCMPFACLLCQDIPHTDLKQMTNIQRHARSR